MSNEEKLKRDRHERMRKGWSIVFITIIVLLTAVLGGSVYINHKSNEKVYIEYTESPKAEYQIALFDSTGLNIININKIIMHLQLHYYFMI